MSKVYGNLINRIDEGHNYNEDKLIHEGDDITMYYYSDRTCYYVTKVIDQKHIFVHRYEVCADHSKPGGMGHQNWLYFKTIKEEKEYLKKYYPDTETENIIESSDEEWIFRYNSWKQVFRYNKDRWQHSLELAKKDCKENASEESIYNLARYYFGLDDNEFEKAMNGKEIVKYYPISQKMSFGVRDYYYDWEF